jgi:cytidyltransferase-like protein
MTYQYKHAVLGGTFDHLHDGHRRILDFAFHIAGDVTIGVVEKPLEDKPYEEGIESNHIRREAIQTYLSQNNVFKRAHIVTLHDIYGPAADNAVYDAIIATQETKPNAQKINSKRKKNGLLPLAIETVPFYKSQDNKILRARRIRQGEVSRNGISYGDLLTKQKQLNLPPRMRELLRKPLGQIVAGEDRFAKFTAQKAAKIILRKKPFMVICVGDIVSKTLHLAQLPIHVSVIDYHTRRKMLNTIRSLPPGLIANPAGTIRLDAIRALRKAIGKGWDCYNPQEVRIKGEEDLLTLPAILLAPLGSMVIYGQAELGIILVQVTEKNKDLVAGIIKQFE